jgi:hypothetical protein
MDLIQIKRNTGETEMMSFDSFSRWMCLVEAFHYIEEKAKEKGLGDITHRIKPMFVEKYIDERYVSMRHDVECEHRLGNI